SGQVAIRLVCLQADRAAPHRVWRFGQGMPRDEVGMAGLAHGIIATGRIRVGDSGGTQGEPAHHGTPASHPARVHRGFLAAARINWASPVRSSEATAVRTASKELRLPVTTTMIWLGNSNCMLPALPFLR